MEVFGDGLSVLYDERIQQFVEEFWGGQPDPDEIPIAEFIRLLECVGAKPSKYHKAGLALSEETRAKLVARAR